MGFRTQWIHSWAVQELVGTNDVFHPLPDSCNDAVEELLQRRLESGDLDGVPSTDSVAFEEEGGTTGGSGTTVDNVYDDSASVTDSGELDDAGAAREPGYEAIEEGEETSHEFSFSCARPGTSRWRDCPAAPVAPSRRHGAARGVRCLERSWGTMRRIGCGGACSSTTRRPTMHESRGNGSGGAPNRLGVAAAAGQAHRRSASGSTRDP